MAEFEYNLLIIHNIKEVRDDIISLFGGGLPQNSKFPEDMIFTSREFVGNVMIESSDSENQQERSRKLYIHTATSAQDYRIHWSDHIHHAVLLNLALPEEEYTEPGKEIGMTLLKEIKRDHPETEVIVFTDLLVLNWAIEAVKNGAFYFIEQPRIPTEFVKALVVRIIQMTEKAHLDSLTALHNRRFFQSSLKNHWDEFNRIGEEKRIIQSKYLSLILIDFDDFKTVNDVCGHPGGDRALQLVAGKIEERFRKTDVKGRIGGDEFAVLLPHMDHLGALKLAERVRAEIERHGQGFEYEVRRNRVDLTISAGVATYPIPNAFPELDQFISEADRALYEGKRKFGKNSVCGYGKDGKIYPYSELREVWTCCDD